MKYEPKDLPSLKNAEQYIPLFKLFLKGRKFFSFFGIGKEKTRELEEQLNSLLKQMEDFKTYPTKYNKYFASDGWIAHDSLNFDTMKNAVITYEEHGANEAKKIIMDFYKPERIENHIFLLRWIPEFESRYKFIEYALNDYRDGRYYSCIPILIMMIDGMVCDAIQKGFHADNIDLNVWDSLTATDTGIVELKKIFQTSRKRTNNEKITLPYRHGILHGRDLGYDNYELATKCWAFLFVIRDWIISKKSESSRIEKHNEENRKISWRDLVAQLQETSDMTAAIDEWKPRIISEDYLASLNSYNQAHDGSPERMVLDFLHY